MAINYKGQVSGFQSRFEARRGPVIVWDFRLERRDPSGNPLPRVPVEMRGRAFVGSINNGDWVEVSGQWRRGVILRPARVMNLSTGVVVRAKGATIGIVQILGILMFLALLLFALAVFARVLGLRGNSVPGLTPGETHTRQVFVSPPRPSSFQGR